MDSVIRLFALKKLKNSCQSLCFEPLVYRAKNANAGADEDVAQFFVNQL